MSDFEEVLRVLGCSFFLNDPRTDLKLAKEKINRAAENGYFNKANKTSDGSYGTYLYEMFSRFRHLVFNWSPATKDEQPTVEDAASLNLMNACFHATCGRFRQAFESLRLVQDSLNVLPRRWAIHVCSIDAYLQCLRRYPPQLGFRPDGGSARDIRNLKTQYQHNIQEAMANVGKISKELGEPLLVDSLECISLLDLVTSNAAEEAAHSLHPAYPDHGFLTSALRQERVQTVDWRIKHLRNVQHRAIALKFDPVFEYAQVLTYSYLRGSNSGEATTVLKTLEQMYENVNQPNGRAMCKMIQADAIASPPWTSPIAFNLIPVDNTGIQNRNHYWDSFEDNVVLTSTTEVDCLYEQAYNLFAQGECARGCAAVLLRQAAVCIIGFNDLKVEDEATWHRRVNEINGKLTQALQLFDEDEARQQIVRGHQVIFGILTGEKEEYLKDVTINIGKWCIANDNEGISQFLGFLLLRFGRRQWLDHNRMDVASDCFRLARDLFAELDDAVATLKANYALIEVHNELSDHLAAKVLLEDNIQLFTDAIHYIDRYFVLSTDLDQRFHLLQQRKALLVDYASFAAEMFSFAGDFAGYAKWETQVAGFSTLTEIQQMFMETQASPELRDQLRENDLLHVQLLTKETLSIIFTFRKATRTFATLLRWNRVEEAVKLMEDFVEELEGMPGNERHKRFTAINANFVIGKTDECRQNLAVLSREQFFGELALRQRPALVFDAIWCRNSWPSRLAYVTEASRLIYVCAMSHAWSQAQDAMDMVLQASPGFYDPKGPDIDVDRSHRFWWAGLVSEKMGRYLLSYQHYHTAASIHIDQRRWARNTDTRISIYSTNNVGDVLVGLARVAFLCYQQRVPYQVMQFSRILRLDVGSWEELIIASLEEGRARSLLDSYDADELSDQQSFSSHEAKTKYHKRLLAHLKALPPNSRSQLENDEIANLVSSSRFSGHTSPKPPEIYQVMQSLTVAELYSAIGGDTLVVQISFSRFGSILTAVTSDGVELITQLEASTTYMNNRVRGVMKSINDYCTEYRKLCQHGSFQTSSSRLRETCVKLDEQLSDVSRVIIDPIKGLIQRKKHVVFGGAYLLSGFPLGALKVDETPLFQLAAVSLTPSLAVHHHLHKRASTVDVHVAAVTKPGSQRDYLVLREKPLPYAGIEAMLVTNMFDTWPVMAKKTTNDDFVSLMEKSTIMHVGTHGQVHPESPHLSKISLKEAFRVLELSRCKSNAALVVFAACLSGISDNIGGNDVQGFARAVLETGTMAFMGALWEVDDVGTMILMVLFYRAIGGRLDHCVIPESMRIHIVGDRSLAGLWRTASLVFYHLDATKAKALIKESIIELEACQQRTGRDPGKIVKNWKTYLEELLVEPEHEGEGTRQVSVLDLIDFKHPFFYASFIPVGYGNLQISLPAASTSSQVWSE